MGRLPSAYRFSSFGRCYVMLFVWGVETLLLLLLLTFFLFVAFVRGIYAHIVIIAGRASKRLSLKQKYKIERKVKEHKKKVKKQAKLNPRSNST